MGDARWSKAARACGFRVSDDLGETESELACPFEHGEMAAPVISTTSTPHDSSELGPGACLLR
jgi:hypothetical protein